MKTYTIEQAQYNLKWHKDRDTLDKYNLVRLRNEDAFRAANPVKYHAFVYNDDNIVACLTRDTYREVETAAQELCSYKYN